MHTNRICVEIACSGYEGKVGFNKVESGAQMYPKEPQQYDAVGFQARQRESKY